MVQASNLLNTNAFYNSKGLLDLASWKPNRPESWFVWPFVSNLSCHVWLIRSNRQRQTPTIQKQCSSLLYLINFCPYNCWKPHHDIIGIIRYLPKLWRVFGSAKHRTDYLLNSQPAWAWPHMNSLTSEKSGSYYLHGKRFT